MSAMIVAAVIGAGASAYAANRSRKSGKEAKGAAEQAAREQQEVANTQGGEIKAAGEKAAGQIREAGQSTPEEQARLARYSGKAQTPGESLMTEAGPISQAVARRIQERVDTPGMDYDTNSAALEQGVGLPIWRALKARGITPPPGSEGGGLGTQQYLSGVYPQLAALRTGQINQDISRGQEYGTEARGEQKYYGGLENVLAEAIRNRLYQSGISAAGAEQAGTTAGGQTIATGSTSALNNISDLYKAQLTGAQASEKESGGALADILSAYLMYQGAGGGKTKTSGTDTGTDIGKSYTEEAGYKGSPLYQKRVAGNKGVYY